MQTCFLCWSMMSCCAGDRGAEGELSTGLSKVNWNREQVGEGEGRLRRRPGTHDLCRATEEDSLPVAHCVTRAAQWNTIRGILIHAATNVDAAERGARAYEVVEESKEILVTMGLESSRRTWGDTTVEEVSLCPVSLVAQTPPALVDASAPRRRPEGLSPLRRREFMLGPGSVPTRTPSAVAPPNQPHHFQFDHWQMQNHTMNKRLTPFISIQNHYSLIYLYREEEREMMPTFERSVRADPDVCGVLLELAGEGLAEKRSMSTAQISLAWALTEHDS
ncbi:hypothetical protein BC826DRAFT_1181730 [Russula brevipes]|nr:hypothetical protein BC826DRAFT_1181730 [Russula brevipes]